MSGVISQSLWKRRHEERRIAIANDSRFHKVTSCHNLQLQIKQQLQKTASAAAVSRHGSCANE